MLTWRLLLITKSSEVFLLLKLQHLMMHCEASNGLQFCLFLVNIRFIN